MADAPKVRQMDFFAGDLLKYAHFFDFTNMNINDLQGNNHHHNTKREVIKEAQK